MWSVLPLGAEIAAVPPGVVDFWVKDVSMGSGVDLRVVDEVSVSSGIVANFFRTCFSAGRRIGLLVGS